MTKVIFSLDEEDFITPEADEAVEFWTKVLQENGIRGSFNVVGERARVLRERGREDIIKLLQFHEINYHSDYHSLHPTFPEYLEELSWDEGVQEVIRKESKGLNDIREIFGQSPIGFMQPGNSGTPQVFYTMALLGLPLMEASFLTPLPPGNLLWYCNSLNGFTWDLCFESYFNVDNRLEAMKEDFENLCEKREIVVLGTHPCRLVTREFWDTVNFSQGKNTPPQEYKPAPLYPKRFVKEFMRDIKAFVEWLSGREDIEFITYRDVLESYKMPSSWVSLNVIFHLAEKTWEKIDYQIADNMSFSSAEICSLFVWTLTYYRRNRCLPERIPVRRTIGPVSEIPTLEEEFDVQAEDFLKECGEINEFIVRWNRVPSRRKIKGRDVGIGSFLKAMAEFLLRIKEGLARERIRIKKAEAYPSIAEELSLPHYANTWLYSPDFKGENIIRVAKFQSWSAKPA